MAKNYVVRHKNDVVNYEVERCQGGEGSIFVRQILGYDVNLPVPGFPEDSEAFHFVHIATLPKGSSVGEHSHSDREEVYLIIMGKAELCVDGRKCVMAPGSVGLVRQGAVHSMKNVGEEDMQMVVM